MAHLPSEPPTFPVTARQMIFLLTPVYKDTTAYALALGSLLGLVRNSAMDLSGVICRRCRRHSGMDESYFCTLPATLCSIQSLL